MKASERVFLDTNILVYAFDVSEPEKRRVALEVFRETTSQGTAVLSRWSSERRSKRPLP